MRSLLHNDQILYKSEFVVEVKILSNIVRFEALADDVLSVLDLFCFNYIVRYIRCGFFDLLGISCIVRIKSVVLLVRIDKELCAAVVALGYERLVLHLLKALAAGRTACDVLIICSLLEKNCLVQCLVEFFVGSTMLFEHDPESVEKISLLFNFLSEYFDFFDG